jgi:hypothetical protein
MLQSLLLAGPAGIAIVQAEEVIGPGHSRWYGRGSGPVGADLIQWVGQRATKAPPGEPDPAYYGTGGGPTGADLIAKLAKVQKRGVRVDLVNAYGRGAPSAGELAAHTAPAEPIVAVGPANVVK